MSPDLGPDKGVPRRSPEDERGGDHQSRARTHLANERTFLAWLRTGVVFIALGLAAAEFLTSEIVPGVPVTRAISVVLILSGTMVALAGARRYFISFRRIEAGQYEPARYTVVASTILMVIIGVMSIVFVLALRR